jgi:hypothetical protein
MMRKPLPPLSELTPEGERAQKLPAALQRIEADFILRLRIVYPRSLGRVELFLNGKWRRMWVM